MSDTNPGPGPGPEDAATAAERAGRTVLDSAQQIWLAGLGAFAKAQAEGSRLFDSLVEEGTAFNATTSSETSSRINEMRGNVAHTFEQVRGRGQGTLNAIENLFAERSLKAMERIGLPGRSEMDALVLRVERLERELAAVREAQSAADTTPTAAQTTRAPRKGKPE
ncbi:MAG: phasin family protein [Xanthomonadales bacterium]|nr:phasin family protein [Xanthomonadales bacterium]